MACNNYFPDIQAMGDCLNCSHIYDDHSQNETRPQSSKLAMPDSGTVMTSGDLRQPSLPLLVLQS